MKLAVIIIMISEGASYHNYDNEKVKLIIIMITQGLGYHNYDNLKVSVIIIMTSKGLSYHNWHNCDNCGPDLIIIMITETFTIVLRRCSKLFQY